MPGCFDSRGETRLGAIVRLAVFLLIVFFISTQMNSLSRLWDNVAEKVESLTQIRSETCADMPEGWQSNYARDDDTMLRRMLEQTTCASYHDDEDNYWRGRGPVPQVVSVLDDVEHEKAILAAERPEDDEGGSDRAYRAEIRALEEFLNKARQAHVEPTPHSRNAQPTDDTSTSKPFGEKLTCKQDESGENLTIIR